MNPKRTLLVTGANTGIGAACVVLLARPGVHLLLACRSEAKTQPVLDRVRALGATADFVALDLADLAASAGAGEHLAAAGVPIDVLINNAGLGGQRGITRDGYELAFGVNHLGHFAFTLPLLDGLAQRGGRVVNVASGNHHRARSIPWHALRSETRTRTGLDEYSVSKLCNVLFTAELRRRYEGVGAVSLNPGRIASDIWRSVPWPLRPIMERVLPMRPVEFGGQTLVHASEVPLDGNEAPLYFNKMVVEAPNPLALREDLARELWAYSLNAVAIARRGA
jgi:NAD(P)-dependent dehydrogenase (short-subunit alcohol dehydrogenase family)